MAGERMADADADASAVVLHPSDVVPGSRKLGRVLSALLPGWATDDCANWLVGEKSEALSNHVYHVVNPTIGEQVIVRVFGGGATTQADERLVENVIVRRLGEAGVGPGMLGTFSDGRVEEYLEGRPIDTLEATRHCADGIATALGRFHAKAEEALGEVEVETLEGRLRRWRKAVVEGLEGLEGRRDGSLSWVSALLDVDLEGLVAGMRGWERGVVHGDVHGLNIIQDEGGSCRLLDFEYVCRGPIAYDLANHFAEWSWAGSLDVVEFRPARYPAFAERRRFCEVYLEERAGCVAVTADVETLLGQCDACLRVSHYHWALWGLLAEQGLQRRGPLDYFEYARGRARAFLELV